jgi:serine phosphatase RsbU (regulator of sigma subunit)
MAELITLQVNPADGESFEQRFDKESFVVGRSTSSDLALADPFLSRFHARLFRRKDEILVEDLGSRNGTFVNGRAIQGATVVRPGDVIKVSGSIISLHGGGSPSTTRPSTITDLGATIFRPAAELLREGDSETHPGKLEGEAALRRYAERLKLYNEIHEALGGSLSLQELLDLILERAFSILKPEQGVIFLRGGSNGDFYRAASRSLPGIRDELPLSRALIEEVCEKGMAALVLDAETDERFSAAQSIIMSGVRSLLATPLLDTDGTLGMIVLSSKAAIRQFEEEDLGFLVSMASIAALKIRNTALAEEAAERRRLEEQLALARRIQVALLPERLPDFPGYQLFGQNFPSLGVSGDYYIAVERAGGRECVLMIADVSGKGIGASLITTSLEALSITPIEDGLPSDEICSKLSDRLHRRSPPEKYATAMVAVLEADGGRVRYTSAGHNPALLLRPSSEVQSLGATGPPIGLVDAASFVAEEIELGPGDSLVLYTDGITEAENPDGAQYGLDRLIDVCQQHREVPLPELASIIERSLQEFAHGVPFGDDRTLLMARRC